MFNAIIFFKRVFDLVTVKENFDVLLTEVHIYVFVNTNITSFATNIQVLVL